MESENKSIDKGHGGIVQYFKAQRLRWLEHVGRIPETAREY